MSTRHKVTRTAEKKKEEKKEKGKKRRQGGSTHVHIYTDIYRYTGLHFYGK